MGSSLYLSALSIFRRTSWLAYFLVALFVVLSCLYICYILVLAALIVILSLSAEVIVHLS